MCKTYKMDLYNDWKKHIRIELKKLGYNIENINDEDLPYRYFNLLNRIVEPKPREVLISKELYESINYKKYKNEIEKIKKMIKNGEDISSFLSRQMKNVDYNDGLLNDWGIHHLHLNLKIENDGYRKRTGDLLYVRFEKDKAYFLNIYGHGNWCNRELIEIIHHNWKEDFEHFRLKGVTRLYPKPTEEEHKLLRGKNVNTLIEIEEGVVYMGPGFGITTAGDSILSSNKVIVCHRLLKEAERYINLNIDKIMSMFEGKIYFYPFFAQGFLAVFELYTWTCIYKVKL